MELLRFSLFFSLSLCIFVAAEPCPASQCLQTGPTVRFPFQNRPGSCGYPGFNLSCGTNHDTILHLHSVPFIVREIRYAAQEIRINGPDLAGKILSLNLSGTPFRGAFYQEFTFFSCPPANRSEVEPIACLSNSTRSVFATSSSPTVATGLFGSCHAVKTVSVPVQPPGYREVPSSNLDQDLVLRWDFSACKECESRDDGWCGLNDTKTLQIGCFSDPGKSYGYSLRVFHLIGLLLFIFLLCLCLYACCYAYLIHPELTQGQQKWTLQVTSNSAHSTVTVMQ